MTERLRELCSGHQDAEVLAEYIVVMVAGDKSREDMATELTPFFPEKKQGDAFISWVEECKSKFLVGGAPKVRPPSSSSKEELASKTHKAKLASRQSSPASASTPGRSQPRHGSSRVQDAVEGAAAKAAKIRKVLVQQQRHNHTDAGTPGSRARTPDSTPPKTAALAALQAPAAAPARPKQNKNELLATMTKQLQTILTKLGERGLDDRTREQYQALAQTIQLQMAKITKPQAAPAPLAARNSRRF